MGRSARRNYKRREAKRYYKRYKLVDLPIHVLHCICNFLDPYSLFNLFLCIKGLQGTIRNVHLDRLLNNFIKKRKIIKANQLLHCNLVNGKVKHGTVFIYERCCLFHETFLLVETREYKYGHREGKQRKYTIDFGDDEDSPMMLSFCVSKKKSNTYYKKGVLVKTKLCKLRFKQ